MFGIIAVCLLITIDRKRPNEYGLGVYVSIYYNKRNFWRFCECDFDFVFGSSKNCSSRWESLRIRYVLLWKRKKKSSGTNTENRIEMTSSHFGSLIHSRFVYTAILRRWMSRAPPYSDFFATLYLCVYCSSEQSVSILFVHFFVVQKFAWLSYSNALSIKITHISRCVW